MIIAFYITNHGYGHASRNVAVIQRFLTLYPATRILIKSDAERCNFIRRNLAVQDSIEYFEDCHEVGLVLKEGTLQPDLQKMERLIYEDQSHWDYYIQREKRFLRACSH